MSRRRPSRWHGLIPVDKKSGPTSHDVVDMARKALGERRIGHTGTLDPMAQGLLLLCVGQATRLQRYLLDWHKSYRGLIRLGRATTTYDQEGETIEPQGPPPPLDAQLLAQLESRFSGTIQQIPPPYSAKKVSGKKLYELARDGKNVEVAPKTVCVHRVELVQEEEDLIAVNVSTSSGFYVRTLAHDIGLALGCGAHLHELERVNIGPYTKARALDQNAFASASRPEDIVEGPAWIPLEKVELPFSGITLNPDAAHRFVHGQEVVVFRSSPDEVAVGDSIAVTSRSGHLLGVGTVRNVLARGRTLTIQPAMVFSQTG